MKHFLEINQLSYDTITRLLQRAMAFKSQHTYPQFQGRALANLFYEPSTRTRISFEMAAKNLGIRVVNVDTASSAENKGEVIEDTIQNLFAMGITHFVLRHKQGGMPQSIAGTSSFGAHIINAGDGAHAHPSQALLDMMTILSHKPNLKRLKIAVVGDVLHSRVASSFQKMCMMMGVGELVLVAPEIWHPNSPAFGRVTSSLQDGIVDADVVITLRVQKERLHAKETMSLEDYHDTFAITKTTLAMAKPDVMIMHPGPINRGVEIDSDVADGPHSYILEQVTNGIFMRMAILEALM
ncbi:MAG: aspartate carbamoyltransferase catalytic subunit [Gammaproteobacteria bacterium]|nr:aspartate carbamoyltransferase catalytic subunit [Gammaproteobacteria bacterium]